MTDDILAQIFCIDEIYHAILFCYLFSAAPEVLKNEGYNRSLDLWSVGVIIYVRWANVIVQYFPIGNKRSCSLINPVLLAFHLWREKKTIAKKGRRGGGRGWHARTVLTFLVQVHFSSFSVGFCINEEKIICCQL